jgi:hypothetical protein
MWPAMRNEERAAIGKIGDTIEDLRARWRNPSGQRQEYVTAGEVPSVNANEQRENPALLARLDELSEERRRIHGLLMDGQLEGMTEIDALDVQVHRLRADFGVLNH